MEHEQSKFCWCCPSVEVVLSEDGTLTEIITHNEREDAN